MRHRLFNTYLYLIAGLALSVPTAFAQNNSGPAVSTQRAVNAADAVFDRSTAIDVIKVTVAIMVIICMIAFTHGWMRKQRLAKRAAERKRNPGGAGASQKAMSIQKPGLRFPSSPEPSHSAPVATAPLPAPNSPPSNSIPPNGSETGGRGGRIVTDPAPAAGFDNFRAQLQGSTTRATIPEQESDAGANIIKPVSNEEPAHSGSEAPEPVILTGDGISKSGKAVAVKAEKKAALFSRIFGGTKTKDGSDGDKASPSPFSGARLDERLNRFTHTPGQQPVPEQQAIGSKPAVEPDIEPVAEEAPVPESVIPEPVIDIKKSRPIVLDAIGIERTVRERKSLKTARLRKPPKDAEQESKRVEEPKQTPPAGKPVRPPLISAAQDHLLRPARVADEAPPQEPAPSNLDPFSHLIAAVQAKTTGPDQPVPGEPAKVSAPAPASPVPAARPETIVEIVPSSPPLESRPTPPEAMPLPPTVQAAEEIVTEAVTVMKPVSPTTTPLEAVTIEAEMEEQTLETKRVEEVGSETSQGELLPKSSSPKRASVPLKITKQWRQPMPMGRPLKSVDARQEKTRTNQQTVAAAPSSADMDAPRAELLATPVAAEPQPAVPRPRDQEPVASPSSAVSQAKAIPAEEADARSNVEEVGQGPGKSRLQREIERLAVGQPKRVRTAHSGQG